MEEWLNKFCRLMFGNGNNESTYAEAAVLKLQNMPQHLYKYRSFCKSHLSALEEGVLYFSNTSIQDDTKESNIVITDQAIAKINQRQYDELKYKYNLPDNNVKNYDDIFKVINTIYKQKAEIDEEMDFLNTSEYNEMRKCVKNQQESMINIMRIMYSICSFSATNCNNQMWAHYADAHRGFCIEYDFKSLGENSLLTALLFPILYVDDTRLIVNDIEQIDGNNGLLAAVMKDKNEWGYQEEWRLIHPLEDDHKPQKMPKPTAIYLGEKTSLKDTKYMVSYCARRSIPLYKMKYNQRTNKIESEKLT